MAIGKDIFALADRIGYRFFDIKYLECAVTHASYSNEQKSRGIHVSSNERMEFLGDSVLELLISEYLYEHCKKFTEGRLTSLRKNLVCEKTLAKIAADLHLGEHLNVGYGEELTDLRTRSRVLADSLEALIAAIYLDSRAKGSEEYREVILRLMSPVLEDSEFADRPDYKTRLQNLIEQDGAAVLSYETVHEEGPDHNKRFTVVCKVDNNVVGTGCATTIKEAQMLAAKKALLLYGVL